MLVMEQCRFSISIPMHLQTVSMSLYCSLSASLYLHISIPLGPFIVFNFDWWQFSLSPYLNSCMHLQVTGVGCGGLSLARDGDGRPYELCLLCIVSFFFFSPSLSLYCQFFFFLVASLFFFYFNKFLFIYTQRLSLSDGVKVVEQYNLSFFNLYVVEFQMSIFPTWQHFLNCRKRFLLLYIIYDIDINEYCVEILGTTLLHQSKIQQIYCPLTVVFVSYIYGRTTINEKTNMGTFM